MFVVKCAVERTTQVPTETDVPHLNEHFERVVNILNIFPLKTIQGNSLMFCAKAGRLFCTVYNVVVEHKRTASTDKHFLPQSTHTKTLNYTEHI